MNKVEIYQKISQVIEGNKGPDGWADFAILGKPLVNMGVNYKALGFQKLRELLEEYRDDIEIKKDDTSFQVPVLYARLKSSTIAQTTYRSGPGMQQTYNTYPIPQNLLQWAWLGDIKQAINDLKNRALDERWYFKTQNPSNPYPILSKYLFYTFYRLSKEAGKIRKTDQYAAFNTGLVNKLYEPIYALFERNRVPGRQKWFFQKFCISGVEWAGKVVTSNFNPMPPKASYFEDANDLFYNHKAHLPQLNWNHIILDNVSRLPKELLEENKPEGFLLRDTTLMKIDERIQYYKDLANAIESNEEKFRTLKNRFSDSLILALKKTEWNFRTAIPMYFPPTNKLSLLLPLSLMRESKIDVALVVEKTHSGNYLGHTILPLDWAYSNARLITRLDSEWLSPAEIETQSVNDMEEGESQ